MEFAKENLQFIRNLFQYMSTEKLRLKLINWIVNEDQPEILSRLTSMMDDMEFEKQSEKKIMGLRANGMEVTKAELLRCVRVSEEQAERGELLSFDELEKHSQTW